jgi:hypothetical protein
VFSLQLSAPISALLIATPKKNFVIVVLVHVSANLALQVHNVPLICVLPHVAEIMENARQNTLVGLTSLLPASTKHVFAIKAGQDHYVMSIHAWSRIDPVLVTEHALH